MLRAASTIPSLVLFFGLSFPLFGRADEFDAPHALATGLKNPESVAIGSDGHMYVTLLGEPGKSGDGSIVRIEDGKTVPVATDLDDPKGIAALGDALVVADLQRVIKVDLKGTVTTLAETKKFPQRPQSLNDVAVDSQGRVYVSDMGDSNGQGPAVYCIDVDGSVTLVTNAERIPTLQRPNGLLIEDADHLLVADFASGELHRVRLRDGKAARFMEGFRGADGLARDKNGKTYVSQWTTGAVNVLPRESRSPAQLGQFQTAADIAYDPAKHALLVPDMRGGAVYAIELARVAAATLDESPLNLHAARAFPNLEFNRPIVLTHASDGTNRVFVASQLGKVFVFPNQNDVTKAELFLDIEDRVAYKDAENEEGFLGMAFHPRFKENGELFIYYTTTKVPHTSVISRFRVSPNDPNRADPASEKELLRIKQPFWNHNGGTIVFGPDGYLYIGLGDGGLRDDPGRNGQNVGTLLGSILRIDVDNPDAGLAYGVPKDNPFVGQPDARGEIWAYGLRNVWRMAFDRQTGVLWAADVGQDTWEEIDLIERGGNYGWNLREGFHKFKQRGSDARADLIEPIFEYHHDVGKSITGGNVYRGKRLPVLEGKYLYADYVTGQLWALDYDAHKRQVVGNHPIAGNVMPVMSFGEDEQGETYFLTTQGWILSFAEGAEPELPAEAGE
jgi:glucose/arabinose dehydrogenase